MLPMMAMAALINPAFNHEGAAGLIGAAESSLHAAARLSGQVVKKSFRR